MSDTVEKKIEPRDITYKMNIDENTNEVLEYFLNDEPWKFVDPSEVKVGSQIWFDPNGLERNGIVTNIRKGDFLYYDVGYPDTLDIEEIAMFQVYKVQN